MKRKRKRREKIVIREIKMVIVMVLRMREMIVWTQFQF